MKQEGVRWERIEVGTVLDGQIGLEQTGGGGGGAVKALGGLCGDADLGGLRGCERYFKLDAAG